MQVRHNTSVLEQAVRLSVERAAIPTLEAQAALEEKAAKAAAVRRVATGAAVAIAAVGLGLGVYFGFLREPAPSSSVASVAPPAKGSDRLPAESVTSAERSTRVGAEERAAPPAKPTPFLPSADQIVTVDYTKFATRKTILKGAEWTLETGHYYKSETDKTWSHAWCYSRQAVDGVVLEVRLADRTSPAAVPQAPVAPARTLAALGLSDADATQLATQCTWLDGVSYTTSQFREPVQRDKTLPTPAPQTPVDQILSRSGWDVIGHDLPDMPMRDVSLEACQASCTANGACMAYTYNRSARACFLKDDASVAVANAQAEMGVRQSVSTRLELSDLVFQTTTRLTGSVFLRRQNVKYGDCIMGCASAKTCAGFNFHRRSLTCEFFGAVEASGAHPDYAAGLKSSTVR